MPRQTSHSSIPLRQIPYVALLAAVSLLTCHSVHAQDTVTGAFQGTVTDSQSGAVLKDAVVEIVNQQTNVTVTQKTDYRGRFFQGLLLPGTYIVRVSMTGYTTKAVQQVLRITYAGEVVPVPVALDPVPTGAVAPAAAPPAAVEENDIRASIITVDGRRSGSFTESEIGSLPLGGTTSTRSFDELALLLPGVAPPPQTLGSVAGPGVGAGVGSAGQFSVNGLRSRANNFTVDGSDNNDEDIGVRRQGFVALVPQPLESIQEYQVITLLAPAQFGRNIGGQVNAVSKSGGSEHHGTVFGRFNSSQLNSRNFFDTAFGNATTTVRANNQDVVVQTRGPGGALLSQRPLQVTNESGDQDSFTFANAGFVAGGPLTHRQTFYFSSFELAVINAAREESFAVPTLSERGAFGSGTTGIFQNPFTGQPIATTPTGINGAAIFSLYPFPNNPLGVYGPNTLTQVLPAGGRGVIFSGKIDQFFKVDNRQQSLTGRYNFSGDSRDIPAVGGAIFSALQPHVRTQNISLFLNSDLGDGNSARKMFNQIRLSYGRTRLRFEELRNTDFLLPSSAFPTTPFLLNAKEFVNVTTPSLAGVPSNTQVAFVEQPINVEQEIGPIGQVVLQGYSSLGTDVYNFPQRRVNNTYQLADQLSWARAKHNLTFGGDARRSELNSELPRNNRPLVTFSSAPRLIFNNNVPRFPTSADPNPIIRSTDLAAIDAPNNLFLTLTSGGPDSINLHYYQLNFFAQDEWRVKRNLTLSLGLRYEFNTPPVEAHRLIENAFSDPLVDQIAGLRALVGVRDKIFLPDHNNFGPRLGVAYLSDRFGPDRITVLRGGFGVFYDQALGAIVSQSRNVFPSFFTLNFGGGPFTTIDQDFPLESFNPATISFGNLQTPIVAPGSLNRLNPQLQLSSLLTNLLSIFPSAISPTLPARQLEMPSAFHYTASVEQQLNKHLVLGVAYVGTDGRHLLRLVTPNLGPGLNVVPTVIDTIFQPILAVPLPEFLGRAKAPARASAGLGGVTLFETEGRSRYDSLQLHLRGRLTRSFEYQTSYTFSSARDDVSDVFDLAGAYALPQDSLTRAGEFAAANFDTRHRFAFNFIWNVPYAKQGGWSSRLLKGVELAGSGQVYSGQPFTVNSIIDVNQDGNLTDRLNTTDGLVVTGDGSQPLALTTNNTLSLLAPFGEDGAVPRNNFRAGSIVDVNLSIAKRFALSAAQSVSVRVEVFNLINRNNFGIPVRLLEAPAFGRAFSTVTPGRRVQFSLKYSF